MRAKGKSKARCGETAGEIVGTIVSAPITRVIVVVIVITRRWTVMPVVIIPRPMIVVVVAVVVMPRPVVPVPPSVTIMMIPSEVRSIVMVGVIVAAASPGKPGPEQNCDGKDNKKFHYVAFHGRSPASIGPFCSN
jgi:hypothetical protein